MTILTRNISREEITCKCRCGQDTIDYELVTVVQDAVDFFLHRHKADKACLIITSANRCKAHNKAIGGAESSQHIKGKAMDIIIKTFDGENWRTVATSDLGAYLNAKYPATYGIGYYNKGRVHIDCRPDKKRWQG